MSQDWMQDYLTKWLIEKQTVLDHKSSDTVVILGSGPSINDLDAQFWDFCSRHDTVAINWWIYHWFVPTFWYIELGYEEPKVRDIWPTLIQKKLQQYQNVIWFHVIDYWLAHVSEDEFKLFYPEGLKMCFYHRVMYKKWIQNINKVFSDCKKHQSIDRFYSSSKSISSALCAIFFAYVMGYERIVLAGIDLDVSSYYWADYDIPTHRKTCFGGTDESFNKYKHTSEADYLLVFEMDELKHGNVVSHPFMSTSQAISLMNEKVFKTEGIQLYTASTRGELYPMLEQFKL